MDKSNPFRALANALWSQGQDGEILAQQVAKTLQWLVREGKGRQVDLHKELDRLLRRR